MIAWKEARLQWRQLVSQLCRRDQHHDRQSLSHWMRQLARRSAKARTAKRDANERDYHDSAVVCLSSQRLILTAAVFSRAASASPPSLRSQCGCGVIASASCGLPGDTTSEVGVLYEEQTHRTRIRETLVHNHARGQSDRERRHVPSLRRLSRGAQPGFAMSEKSSHRQLRSATGAPQQAARWWPQL